MKTPVYRRIVNYLLLFTLSAFVANTKADEFLFGIHPYLEPGEIEQKFQPLVEELSKQLGLPVRLVVSENYDTHIEKVLQMAYDFSYLGPVSVARIIQQKPSWPLLGRLEVRNRPYFQGKIVVRVDAGYHSLRDLVGKAFAFGNKGSTMSYLVPRYALEKSGIMLEDFSQVLFEGSHDNVAQAVIEGRADAGAVKEAVFFKNYGELRAIASTEPVSEHVFSASPVMPEPIRSQAKEILLDLDNSLHGRRILRNIKRDVTAIVPTSADDYDNLVIMLERYKN